MPPEGARAAWTRSGKTPVLIGSSDTHDGFFQIPERTIIIAPSADGADLAEAVRREHVVARFPEPDLLEGPKEFRAMVFQVLGDTEGMRRKRAERIREYLRNAKIVELLDECPVEMVPPEEIPGKLE